MDQLKGVLVLLLQMLQNGPDRHPGHRRIELYPRTTAALQGGPDTSESHTRDKGFVLRFDGKWAAGMD